MELSAWNPKPILLFLHIGSVVIWVGGMFFAYMCLRPVAAQQLQPQQRLPLWAAVFEKFFPWVWAAVALILVSGLSMILQTGFRNAPLFWHVMFGLGILMMLIFAHVYFAPYRRLQRGVSANDWPGAAQALNQMRRLVGINLTLGMITIAVATLGRLFPV